MMTLGWSNLRLKWSASIIPDGVIDDSNPPAIYQVIDDRDEAVGIVENKRASGLPPSWQISMRENGRLKPIEGYHDTAEAALAALQRRAN